MREYLGKEWRVSPPAESQRFNANSVEKCTQAVQAPCCGPTSKTLAGFHMYDVTSAACANFMFQFALKLNVL